MRIFCTAERHTRAAAAPIPRPSCARARLRHQRLRLCVPHTPSRALTGAALQLAEAPEELKIRGYRLQKHEALELCYDTPGAHAHAHARTAAAARPPGDLSHCATEYVPE